MLVRLPAQADEAGTQRAVSAVRDAVEKAAPGTRVLRVEAVGNTVSAELFQGGLIALGISFLAMLLYIWFRFEWHFGVAAIATLLLDTTKTVGLMVLFGIEFNLTTVAAILTVIGFSANDKVVVFDRMRENLRRYKTMPMRELVDLSINETMNRSIGTSMTLLLVGAAAGAVRRRHPVGLRLGDGGGHRDLARRPRCSSPRRSCSSRARTGRPLPRRLPRARRRRSGGLPRPPPRAVGG